jgi:small subunit ribosomal protein S4
MSKETKYKICRRLGTGVFEKCQTQKFVLSEQKKSGGKKFGRRKQVSDYGLQLLEKQKIRFTYGLKERQLVKYVKESLAFGGSSVYETLFKNIESRLDNVVFRLGLASTRAAARQMVVHGHITVNGRKLNIPSYNTKIGDVISVRKQSQDKTLFENLEEKVKERSTPNWLVFDIKVKQGKISGVPKIEKGGETFDLRSVFEYYSR